MTLTPIKTALAALSASALLATAAPAIAAVSLHSDAAVTSSHDTFENGRKNGWRKQDRRYNNYNSGQRYYSEPVGNNTRVWQGDDGRYYCRKENGTTGLLIGGAVGGLVGHEVAGRGDRTLGAIIGAAGGAILGRAIDRSNSRCR